MLLNKLRDFSAKQLSTIFLFQQIITIFLALGIVFVIKQLETSKYVFLIFFFVLIEFLLLWLQLKCRQMSNTIGVRLLTEELDLKKYQEYNYYRHGRNLSVSRKHEAESQRLNEGQIAYFSGNFSDAITLLSQLDTRKVVTKARLSYQIAALYYRILSHIQLGQVREANEYLEQLEQLSEENSQAKELHIKGKAIRDIVGGSSNDYFEKSQSKTALEFLEQDYFNSLNLIHAN